jgi:ketosteroid isomerase-like protein
MLDSTRRAADTGRAMSQENVDVVVTAVDAVNRADVEAFVACFHPDVEWVVSGERFPGFGGTYRGHEGVRRWLEQALEPWESVHLDIEEITEPSQDRLVVGVLMTTRGGGSGVETRLRIWQVFLLADGQVTKRTGPYWTRDAAPEAAGLRE